jgi:hypothetical protein
MKARCSGIARPVLRRYVHRKGGSFRQPGVKEVAVAPSGGLRGGREVLLKEPACDIYHKDISAT